ncbi:MAG: ATP-binding protein [Sphingobacteriia bacterium]|nr:ATP-binding protein [Sphingobacteriia bacterium]
MKRKFSASSRLINELFTQYQSTFLAFCELINNCIQAGAKNIRISIDYAKESELFPTLVKKIVVRDDGHGVHEKQINRKILDIGDSDKKGGKGIGRFAALQIGGKVHIETVGFDNENGGFSKMTIPLFENTFSANAKINDLEIETKESVLNGKHETYYQVTIENLYDATVTGKNAKRRISEKLLKANIANSIFERYPIPIFTRSINFYINGKYIEPNDFVIGEPEKQTIDFTDKKGDNHNIQFTFINLTSNFDRIKIFLTTKNAGIDTIVSGFEYDAEWLSPKIGSWFVYIHMDGLPTDMYRNLDLDGMDDSAALFKGFVKEVLNNFFKAKNKEYDDFSQKLKNDDYYPYKEKSKITSKSKVVLFDKLAFLVEEKYSLINNNNKLREIIYPLIDKTISGGELDNILKKILHLENKYIKKFNELLERSEMEDIIEFSEKVSQKMIDVAFLERITLAKIKDHVQERKDLHKVLEKMLWIFGERYLENTKLLSDTNLENNLKELRKQTLAYKASASDDNINEGIDKKLKTITDLFLYSEKIIDEKKREVLIVELKAPKVKLSPKELDQVMGYANDIETKDFFSNNIHFHIVLIGSSISDKARFRIKGQQKGKDDPYYFFENETGNIRISVMKWADLLENNKRKLKYMSAQLKTKDISIQERIEKDFSEIEFKKVRSFLRTVSIQD